MEQLWKFFEDTFYMYLKFRKEGKTSQSACLFYKIQAWSISFNLAIFLVTLVSQLASLVYLKVTLLKWKTLISMEYSHRVTVPNQRNGQGDFEFMCVVYTYLDFLLL